MTSQDDFGGNSAELFKCKNVTFYKKGVSCSNIFAINDNISTVIQTPHMYFKKVRFYKIKNLKYLS